MECKVMRNKNSLFDRRFYRVSFEQPVEFRILKYNYRYITHLSAKKGPGTGRDIGEDGLSFISTYCLPVDMILRVDFELPGTGEQGVLARVVRSIETNSGYLTAVQFLNLQGPRKDKLREFIIDRTKRKLKFFKYI
jgi:hypothetical protein